MKVKESKRTRKERIKNSIKTFTKVITPKKGKGSYKRDDSNDR